MSTLPPKHRCALVVSAIFVALFVCANQVTQGEKIPMDPAKNLQQLGYPTDTLQQILTATKSRNYFVRHQALEVLSKRIGKEAIHTLRLFLTDPEIEVRCRTAHLLGTLGDKSGLEQMRQDLVRYAPQNGAPLVVDPNTDQRTIQQQEAKRNFNLRKALKVAKVLAELGDRRGYELAVRMALEGPLDAQRYSAVEVLMEIVKTDKAILQAEGIDPFSTLCEMAAYEKSRIVFLILVNSVQKLDVDIAVPVLTIAKDNPNQTGQTRRAAERILSRIEKKDGGR